MHRRSMFKRLASFLIATPVAFATTRKEKYVGPYPPRPITPTIDLNECMKAHHRVELDIFCTGHRENFKTFTLGDNGVCFDCNQRGWFR